jgi:hypothetical protein
MDASFNRLAVRHPQARAALVDAPSNSKLSCHPATWSAGNHVIEETCRYILSTSLGVEIV